MQQKSNIQQQKSQEEHEQQSEIVPSKNEAEERGEIAINYQTPKLLEVYPESHRGKTKVSDVVERSVENIGRSFVQASKRKGKMAELKRMMMFQLTFKIT